MISLRTRSGDSQTDFAAKFISYSCSKTSMQKQNNEKSTKSATSYKSSDWIV